jgi:excisionase family DNA binding protein
MSDLPAFLAEQMGVSRRTVQRWFDAGKIQGAYRTRGGHWRVRRSRGSKKLWKLRETLTELERRKFDRINELVVGYTSEGGYRPPISDFVLAKQIIELAARRLAAPAPLTVAEAVLRMKDLQWAKMVLDLEIEKEMEERTASQEFNDALEFSTVAKGICDDDRLPGGLKDVPRQERSRVVYQHFKELEEREQEEGELDKFRYLMKTPMLDMISEDAYHATDHPHGMLMVKAEKLRLNMRRVTPKDLA